MALTRGFTPAQFRDSFLGVIGPVPVSVTIASTAAGASSTINVAVPGVLPGDIVFVIPAVNPTNGCIIDASAISAGNVTLYTAVATGGTTYNPGAQTLTFVALRAKTA